MYLEKAKEAQEKFSKTSVSGNIVEETMTIKSKL